MLQNNCLLSESCQKTVFCKIFARCYKITFRVGLVNFLFALVLDQTITYRIERGNVDGAFEINHDTGLIKLARGLDYDFGQQSYNLTVLASDGKLAGRAYVQVLINCHCVELKR